MATPILTSIGSLSTLLLLDTTVLFEVESTTEGSKKLTMGEMSNFIVTAAGSTFYSKTEADTRYYTKSEVYTKTEADDRYKPIDATTSWNDLTEKPAVIAAGTTAADARAAIGAGTSNLSLGTEAGTAAAGNDPRIVGAIQSTEKGAANGVATLNGVGQVPAEQLPSFVDDVLEFADLAAFPETGEGGKIYVAIDTDLTYRWTGTGYRRIADGDVTTVNGRKGNVTGLAEQSSLDTVAGERYTKTESDSRFVNKATSDTGDYLYGRSDTDEVMVPVSTGNTANTLVKRTSDGRVQVNPAADELDAVNYAQLTAMKSTVDEDILNVGKTLTSYSLPVEVSTGNLTLSEGQVYILDVSEGPRTVTLTVPIEHEARSFVYVIKINGDDPVNWPTDIIWSDESAPILGNTFTIVNLLYIAGSWIGSVLVARDELPV